MALAPPTWAWGDVEPRRLTPPSVSVDAFRIPRVCLQRSVSCTLQQPLDSGTTARRTFVVGANPQRGDSSCPFRPRIFNPSPAFLPPATSGFAPSAGAILHLIVRLHRALMDTRLTALRKEKLVETTMQNQIDGLARMTVGQLKQKHRCRRDRTDPWSEWRRTVLAPSA
jgi:hypothetical protein